MSKILMISPEKCIGCRSCELICTFNKTGHFNPKQSAVSVMTYEEAAISVPVMCMQCEDPSCKRVCPTVALSRNEIGAVVFNENKCIVCKMCISACPLGNITFDSKQRKVVKCDLCGGEAKCAQFCPSGAIQYKEGTSANLNRKKLIGEKFKDLLGEVNE
jgi:anaerobic carbon-monoxide dehydrogenase iron sulfur subunit